MSETRKRLGTGSYPSPTRSALGKTRSVHKIGYQTTCISRTTKEMSAVRTTINLDDELLEKPVAP